MKLILGWSKRQIVRDVLISLGFAAWAVFINLINVWLVQPLIDDLAALGILCVIVIAAIWLFSVPRGLRRSLSVLTLAALLLGQGLAGIAQFHILSVVSLGILALIALTSWFGRLTVLNAAVTLVALVGLNWVVPVSDWPLLAEFSVVLNQAHSLDLHAFSVTPLFVTQLGKQQSVVTVQNVGSQSSAFLKQAYSYQQISATAGHIRLQPASAATLAQLPPNEALAFTSPLFQPLWHVQGGRLLVSFQSSMSTLDYARWTASFTSVPVKLSTQWSIGLATAEQSWKAALAKLGEEPVSPALYVSHGVLKGTYNGQSLHLPVSATKVVAQGSFSRAGAHELLLEGGNLLQVVSLDKHPHVISTYHLAAAGALYGQLFVGPIDAAGRDAVYVNDDGGNGDVAHILEMTSNGRWRQVYTAPNPHLRFLAAVQFQNHLMPEIIANDTSYLRSTSTTVYLTSYRFEHGRLERNWRMDLSDVNNAAAVHLLGPQSTQLVLAEKQRIVVVRRHDFPAVQLTAGLFTLVVIGGFAWQLASRRKRHD